MSMTLKMKKTKNNFQEFLKGLQGKYNIKFLYCEFSGSGDSGEIHDVVGHVTEDAYGEGIELQDDDRNTVTSFLMTTWKRLVTTGIIMMVVMEILHLTWKQEKLSVI